MDQDLAFAPATEIRQLIASKKLSPVEITELFFSRIESLDPHLNAYLTLSRDEALSTARESEQAVVRGDRLCPLHGVPISIKDLEMTAGIRTTLGSLLFKDRVPDVDSAVVERVRAAGAIILGKTNTPEFGMIGHTENRLGDHCRNPWDIERTPGGSSGGACASLAAGLCSLATGSDGGGSVRIPASFSGVYGIKPTQGRVPFYAGAPAPPVANLASQSGPISRTVRDSALLLQVLAGHDPRDAISMREAPDDYLAEADRGVEGLRVAYSPDFGYAFVEPEVAELCSRAAGVFEELGCSVDQSDLALDPPFDVFGTVFNTVASARYEAIVAGNTDLLTDYTRGRLEHGAKVSGPDFIKSLGELDRMKARFAELFERYDVLLSPTVATTAFPVGSPPGVIAGREIDPFEGYTQFTAIINLVGHPAASVPCGFSSDGLPVGLHIVGRKGDEATVIAASAAFEQARPWAQHRPPVA
jgi:aspartyl-tRNA(Asn)/glutamyl-tRNA(Gln) amidotransferase subunit A